MGKTLPAITLVTAFIAVASVPVAAQERAGVVTTADGPVTVTRSSAASAPLKFKDNIFVQDQVATGDRALARMLLGGKAVVTVREYSSITITEVPGKSIIDIASGKMSLSVARERMKPGEVIDIRTPNAVASVRGTVVVAEVGRVASGEITSGFTVMRGVVDVNRIDAAKNVVGAPVQVGLLQKVDVDGSQINRPIPAAQAATPATLQRINNDFPPHFVTPPGQVTSGIVAPGQVTQALVVAREIVAATRPGTTTPTTPTPTTTTTTTTTTTDTAPSGQSTTGTSTGGPSTTTPTTETTTTEDTTADRKGRFDRRGPQSEPEQRGRFERADLVPGLERNRELARGNLGLTGQQRADQVRANVTNFVIATVASTPRPPALTATPSVNNALIGKQVIDKVQKETVEIARVNNSGRGNSTGDAGGGGGAGTISSASGSINNDSNGGGGGGSVRGDGGSSSNQTAGSGGGSSDSGRGNSGNSNGRGRVRR